MAAALDAIFRPPTHFIDIKSRTSDASAPLSSFSQTSSAHLLPTWQELKKPTIHSIRSLLDFAGMPVELSALMVTPEIMTLNPFYRFWRRERASDARDMNTSSAPYVKVTKLLSNAQQCPTYDGRASQPLARRLQPRPPLKTHFTP